MTREPETVVVYVGKPAKSSVMGWTKTVMVKLMKNPPVLMG